MDTELFELLRKRLEQSVKTKRYEHSLRVTQAAETLCEKFGADFSKARIAGIAHDMCKDISQERMLELCARGGNDISELEKNHPSLLHGMAAAVTLRDEYGIVDEDILEAVRFHTFGRSGMSDIAKIVYIADKIEPGRKRADTNAMNIEAFSLDELLYYVVDRSIAYLEQKGEKVSPFSYKLRDGLREIL